MTADQAGILQSSKDLKVRVRKGSENVKGEVSHGPKLESWTSNKCPPPPPCLLAVEARPDKDEDGFAIVSPIYNPGGAQEGLQDFHQARGHFVHFIEEEKRPATGSEVPLDPALELLL